MSVAYGIDFGTTNSVLARATSAGTEAIILDDQLPGEWQGTGFDKVLPSVIGFDGAERPLFGWLAKTSEGAKLEAVKRLFATEDEVVIGDRKLKVETAAAAFFRHIQQRAAVSGLLERLDRAVVTIPANSRGKARYRTKLTAGLAGIEVSALINEPTAAAMAHARAIGQNQRILVFDWGGGTLDVTVLEAIDGIFIEQSSKGIQRLGGIDLDKKFMDTLLPRIPGSGSWRPHEEGLFRVNLERAKIALSSAELAPVPLPGGGSMEVTRGQFVEAVRQLIERTREPVETCLRESPGRIDHLVMVGGSSKIPAVQRMVADIVGVEPDTRVDPMTAIAEGAAIADAILQGIITDLQFFVGTEHALGTVVHNDDAPREGEFSVLIGRNTKYPARATDGYTPANDFQEEVAVQVIEGDPEKPIGHEDNVILKDWTVTLPEKRLKQDSAFDITYLYDVDGILHVTVQDKRSGRILMAEELSFGAAQDRSQLPHLRREVDQLMSGTAPMPNGHADGSPPSTLSAASVSAVKKARDKVIPFVTDEDRRRLEALIAALEGAGPQDEADCRSALERELRVHAYLLLS
ncbi:Hsp70 family protein [Trebonia sp.]|uniref:Hsp70 family protein n=1 Tax=Trebonia sp. TaxID=2767075 RepID=UPI00260BC002|nr:Hsp70 family protein [Trebonia sp.]